MKEYLLKDIEPGCFFSQPVYLDKSFIIATPEMSIDDNLIGILKNWSYDKVLCEGEPREGYVHDLPEEGSSDFSTQLDVEELKDAEEFYADFLSFTKDLFVRFSVADELSYNAIHDKIKNVTEYTRENKRFIMRMLSNTNSEVDQNYITTHSVRATILAIIIGIYLKLPSHRLIELGVASIIHDIGMLKLPSNLYMSANPISDQEKKAITTHTIIGYHTLKKFEFPLSICLAVLEHHERENGFGYPRNLTGNKISMFSKIIAVACSYEALGSKRPYRAAKKDGYAGMVELLKNDGKQYDETVVKALVRSLSIYPIGLYVLLSNDKKGQVIGINPDNPRFPVVQIFGDITPDGKNKTAQTEPEGLAIVRPLTISELESGV